MQVRLIADGNRLGGHRYRGLMHLITTVLREEGPRGIYRGVFPTVAKLTFNIACRFALYDRIVLSLEDLLQPAAPSAGVAIETSIGTTTTMLSSVVSLTAGGLAGAITVVANHPIDVSSPFLRTTACSLLHLYLIVFSAVFINR